MEDISGDLDNNDTPGNLPGWTPHSNQVFRVSFVFNLQFLDIFFIFLVFRD